MRIMQNPAHPVSWASSHISAYLAGILPGADSTTIQVYGRNVGKVQGDVFVKYPIKSKHLYKKYNGWCSNISSLEEVKRLGVRWVTLHEQEESQTYRVAIATIFDFGKDVNEGHGKQLCLPLKYWSRGDEPCGEQLELWEVRDA